MSEIKRAIALGFFDGVHTGHAALLNRTKQRASEIGAEPSVLSFDVHPDTLVFGKEVPLINSAIGREDIIRVKNAYRKAKSLDKPAREKTKIPNTRPKQAMTIRQAVLAPHEYIKVEQAEGRICGNPTVSCPPAVPIAVSGELITKEICDIFKLYGIDYISVVKLNA